jgi:G3E family GTPase
MLMFYSLLIAPMHAHNSVANGCMCCIVGSHQLDEGDQFLSFSLNMDAMLRTI